MSLSNARIQVEGCVYSDDAHAICVLGRVLLTYSLAQPNAAYLQSWTGVVGKLEAPILVLTVIDSRARAPDAASKAAIAQTITRNQHKIGAFCYVIEGDGFAGAAMRSALSLISLGTRYPFPQRVTATAREAAPWLIKHLPPEQQALQEASRVVRSVDLAREALTRGRAKSLQQR
ncbi:MAG TPA: hypothetical protein VHM70_05150 [Polyangiaceae bacterium]|nr:hypothetical protein [Polyangiaceae bacterium]